MAVHCRHGSHCVNLFLLPYRPTSAHVGPHSWSHKAHDDNSSPTAGSQHSLTAAATAGSNHAIAQTPQRPSQRDLAASGGVAGDAAGTGDVPIVAAVRHAEPTDAGGGSAKKSGCVVQ